MSARVKICGITTREDALATAAAQPDAMGFVFWPKSKRAVRPETIAPWVHELPSTIRRVGVFVDPTWPDMEQAVSQAGLHVVQIHFFQSLENSPENFPIIGKIRSVTPALEIWQAVQLGGREDARICEHVDALLVDSYSADMPGGTGRIGDWRLARSFVERSAKPVWLAGGLTPENVADALAQVRPYGVDVSSGVERSPGRKDPAKVKAFIERCKQR